MRFQVYDVYVDTFPFKSVYYLFGRDDKHNAIKLKVNMFRHVMYFKVGNDISERELENLKGVLESDGRVKNYIFDYNRVGDDMGQIKFQYKRSIYGYRPSLEKFVAIHTTNVKACARIREVVIEHFMNQNVEFYNSNTEPIIAFMSRLELKSWIYIEVMHI